MTPDDNDLDIGNDALLLGDRRSPSERELDDLFGNGVDEAALLERIRVRANHHHDGTFTVVGFEVDQPSVDVRIDILVATPGLRGPFAAAIARRARAANVRSLYVENRSLVKFLDFLRAREQLHIQPRDITNELLDDYRDWLDEYRTRIPKKRRNYSSTVFPKKGDRKLEKTTKIAWMGQILTVLRILRVDPEYHLEIRRDLDMQRAGDWARKGARSTAVKILTRPQLKKLVNICRLEVEETTLSLKDAWSIMAGEAATGKTRADPDLLIEVARLHAAFKGKPPTHSALLRRSKSLEPGFPALRGLTAKQYRAALATLYPTGRLLAPFLLLFAIYYRYNRSLLTTLRKSDFSEQPSPHGMRLAGQKFKNRANRMQRASWPVTADEHNPTTMLETLTSWTSFIRDEAPEGHGNHLFLHRTSKNRTFSFANGPTLDRAFRDFLKDHEAAIGARFTLRSLRPTVIDLVHHLFDGDLLATSEAGQHTVRTLVGSYLTDGARKAHEEALVPAAHMLNGWMNTNGLVDAREDKRRGVVSAATPGFECGDRYGSTMPGQRPQTFCTAYGMCGSCKHGHPQINSPGAYALVMALREALLRSRPRMPAESWIARWAPILDRLETHTLHQFPIAVRKRADMDIPPLPTVE